MKSLDTNVLIRLIVEDDEEQTALAKAFIDSEKSHVGLTVLLEIEWVLRSRYQMAREAVATAIEDIIALPGVHVDDQPAIDWAIARYRAKADWPDLIHLLDAARTEGLVTFDRKSVRNAGPDAPAPVFLLT